MQVQVVVLKQQGMMVALAAPDKIHTQGIGVVWHPWRGICQLRIRHQKETAAREWLASVRRGRQKETGV